MEFCGLPFSLKSTITIFQLTMMYRNWENGQVYIDDITIFSLFYVGEYSKYENKKMKILYREKKKKTSLPMLYL